MVDSVHVEVSAQLDDPTVADTNVHRSRHQCPSKQTPMSIEADTTERFTTKSGLPAVLPMRSDEMVLLTVLGAFP